jgi:uncharacterized protein YkwD
MSKVRLGVLLLAITILTGFSHSFSSLSMEKVLSLVNADRARMGLAALDLNPTLNLAAFAHAEDMISHHYFAHTSPQGLNPWDWIKSEGYNYAYAGENLGLGYSDAKSLENSWMNSATHRANILSPNYRDMGVAVIKSNDSTLVVQMFGSPHKLSQK